MIASYKNPRCIIQEAGPFEFSQELMVRRWCDDLNFLGKFYLEASKKLLDE